ncbi:MAG: hypothetical protein V4459_05945 [Pseudomonadota bacterium]
MTPIFALLLTFPGAPTVEVKLPLSAPIATADQYRSKRYSYRPAARSSRDRPRYYSFKTKRGVTILCKTTWRGSQSTRTCWPRH